MNNLAPLANRIIVRQDTTKKTKSAGGLLIPESDQQMETIGEVLAVGIGKWVAGKREPIDFAVGDNVLFGAYSGTRIKWDGEELIVMFSDDVLAVLA